jgi:hypothetical protein
MGLLKEANAAADRLRRMMDKTGVDLSHLSGRELADLMNRAGEECRACQEVELCAYWLDYSPEDHDVPGFCPNADRYEALLKKATEDA